MEKYPSLVIAAAHVERQVTSLSLKVTRHILSVRNIRAILCKYGASYIGTISRSNSDFDETC